MSDDRTGDDGLPAEATAVEQIIPPEQPPMDDAAGPDEDYSGDRHDAGAGTRTGTEGLTSLDPTR
jgi:hypothetical protein